MSCKWLIYQPCRDLIYHGISKTPLHVKNKRYGFQYGEMWPRYRIRLRFWQAQDVGLVDLELIRSQQKSTGIILP